MAIQDSMEAAAGVPVIGPEPKSVKAMVQPDSTVTAAC